MHGLLGPTKKKNKTRKDEDGETQIEEKGEKSGKTEEDRQRGGQRKDLGTTESETGLRKPGRDRTH